MYHTITLADDLLIHFAYTPSQRRGRLLIPKGARRRAQIKPYVVETEDGPVEVADLFFKDGPATHMVRCERFSFVD
jgi:hypothetical protein